MWRWSCNLQLSIWYHLVFSTYVEVILMDWLTQNVFPWFSPRMWRWSSCFAEYCLHPCVFSTYVEVILNSAVVKIKEKGFLHVCGGDPHSTNIRDGHKWFSPRMWRWSPSIDLSVSFSGSFLHVCGGDPSVFGVWTMEETFSPRMWRWSWLQL